MRRATALILLVLACVVPAACGGGGEEVAVRDRLVEALQKARQTSARALMIMRVDSERDGKMFMRGTVVDTGDGSRGTFDGRFTQDGQTIDLRMIMRPGIGWFRMPQLDRVLPPGKRWIESTDPELVASQTISPSDLGEVLKASGDVEDRGNKRIEGKQARHLHGTVDLDELADKVDESQANSIVRLMAGGDAEMTIDVWIGPDDLPLRYRIDMNMPRPGGGPPQIAEIELIVDEYGVPVDTSAPPARLVTDDSVLE